MRAIILVTLSLLLFSCTGKNVRTYSQLSKIYDYSITFNEMQEGVNNSNVSVAIIRKTDKKVIQTIVSSYQGFGFNCSSRSYITGYNKDTLTYDGDWANIVVADFNFDGKEDIAVKTGAAANGTEYFDFYIQNNNGQFIKDDFLSANIKATVHTIDYKNHVLITAAPAGASNAVTRTFGYDTINAQWHKLAEVWETFENGKTVKRETVKNTNSYTSENSNVDQQSNETSESEKNILKVIGNSVRNYIRARAYYPNSYMSMGWEVIQQNNNGTYQAKHYFQITDRTGQIESTETIQCTMSADGTSVINALIWPDATLGNLR